MRGVCQPLGRRCPQCGSDNPPGFAFCGQCGTPLTEQPPAPRPHGPTQLYTRHLAEKILTSKSALEGERKQVTVLFADLKGSMELLADRDPEEARQLLDPVLERMMAAVHRYEGTVNQVMGDGIMALFGAPIAHEDHAVRACYAALRMQAADAPLRRRGAADARRAGADPRGAELRRGGGAGDRQRPAHGLLGGGPDHAPGGPHGADGHAGQILITPATLRLVEGFVQVNAAGAGAGARGWRSPVEVYELVGAGTVRSRLQAAAARGLTRFVGRQTELEALQQALERAGAGHGQVVALVGEAGVGKSRLVYEFVHSHRHPGLAGAGERLGVLRQGHAVFPGHRPAQALLPCRGAR